MNDARRETAAGALLDRVNPLVDWPRGATRFGVALCVALAAVLGLVQGVRAIAGLGDVAGVHASENYDDREIGGGNSMVVDNRALYEARAHIPEDGTFRVVTGPGVVEGATELTEPYVDQFARSFLMPRRPSPDSPWIICYGCDRAELGRAEVVWDNGAGIALLRLPA